MFTRIVLIVAGILMIYFGLCEIFPNEKYRHSEIQPNAGQGKGMLILGTLWLAIAGILFLTS